MSRYYVPGKTAEVPPIGRVDLTGFLPLVNTAEYRRLREKSQLGLVGDIFPLGKHDRMAHSYGVKGVLDMYLDGMFARGVFPRGVQEQLRRDLGIVALTHDLGHPPFSHIIECLLRYTSPEGKRVGHKERGMRKIIGPLAKNIMECGSDPSEVIELLNKKAHNEGRIVTDKSIGADKVAYLMQDQHMTGFNTNVPARIQDLSSYIVFNRDPTIGLAMEEKGLDLARGIQQFYFRMWTQVYLRKQCLSVERMMQKAVERWIKRENVNPEKVWDMPEYELRFRLAQSTDHVTKKLIERIESRNYLKAAVAFKRFHHTRVERIAGKHEVVEAMPESLIHSMATYYEDPQKISTLEDQIGQELGLKKDEVIVTTPPEPDKLMPEDIKLLDANGRLVGSVFDLYPGDREQLQNEGSSFYAFRIMVPESQRRRTASASKSLRNIVEHHIRSNHIR